MSRVRDLEVAELTAQVRGFPVLEEPEVGRLLAEARADRRAAATERLVEDQLGTVLDEALTRAGRGIEVGDLFQEGSVAALVAVSEYAGRGGGPPGLQAFVAKVVAAHLEGVIEATALEVAAEEAFVRDAQTYEVAEVRLRHELGRGPTTIEMAAALDWLEERVALMAETLDAARVMHDSEIVEYLDDADDLD